MSGYSFPNDEDDLHTRLIYIVSAEFIYRLDELLETAHEHPSRTTAHPEMRDIVYESACVALKMLSCLGAESANPADLNFAQFAVGPAGRAFRPAVESLVKAAAKALCVAQRAKVSEQSNLETTKHKAQSTNAADPRYCIFCSHCRTVCIIQP